MPFFIRNKERKQQLGKRNRKHGNDQSSKKYQKKNKKYNDEEIISDSEIESDVDEADEEKLQVEPNSDEEETAQEKRLRLAKQYLAQLQTEEADKISDDEELTRDVISNKLKQQFLEQSGKLQKDIAQQYCSPSAEDICTLRGHQLSVTCLVITTDDKYIFSAAKDCSIIKWDLSINKKVKTIPGGLKGTEDTHLGHTDHILCMSVSTDSKYLVSGGKNKNIYVWNPETCERLHLLKGHRDSISGLAFRKGTHQLFSSSHDRTVKIWNVDENAYIETLFGHEDKITGVDSLTRERAITSGGMDGSIRIWKVIEESQLVFHGHSGSIDCVSLINEEHFVSGADNNSLTLWSIMKKKPLYTKHNAHPGEAGSKENEENWITSVVALQYTDLVASGSRDGCIRLWKCGHDFKSLTLLFSIPMCGFVNSLKFSTDGQKLIAGVGQEHRLGRWWSMKAAKNAIKVINLTRQLPEKKASVNRLANEKNNTHRLVDNNKVENT